MTAKELKKQVAQIRRVVTALRRLSMQLEIDNADRAAIDKTSQILSRQGKRIDTQAIEAKRQETKREQAIASAQRQAVVIIATWAMETLVDRIALCIGNHLKESLCRDLAGEGGDLAWSLNYWVEQCMREIPEHAAWRAVQEGKSVEDLMAVAFQRLQAIRCQSETIALANAWQERLVKTGNASSSSEPYAK